MTSLQKVAMGLVIVVLDVSFDSLDVIADPLGWLLVLLGVLDLRGREPRLYRTLLGITTLALVVSVPLWLDPELGDAGWLLSLPALIVHILLCHVVAELVEDHDPTRARRLRVLRWAFVAIALLPAVVLGGGVTVLAGPVAFLAVVAVVYQIWLFFALAGTAERRRPQYDGAPPAAR